MCKAVRKFYTLIVFLGKHALQKKAQCTYAYTQLKIFPTMVLNICRTIQHVDKYLSCTAPCMCLQNIKQTKMNYVLFFFLFKNRQQCVALRVELMKYVTYSPVIRTNFPL